MMRTTILAMAMVATIMMSAPARADSIRMISYDDYIRSAIPPKRVLPINHLDESSKKQMRWLRCRLQHPDKQIPVGPCRLGKDYDYAWECQLPPLNAFPWSGKYRNMLLDRPSPEIVRSSIELVTNGTLSTVEELVEKANANLEHLDTLTDAELTLLATNFWETEPGMNSIIECPRDVYNGWPEDLLVPEKEQRALISAFLFVVSDEEYLSRRDRESQQLLKRHNMERAEFMFNLNRKSHRFVLGVAKLDADVLLPEQEWIWRYEELVRSLKAVVYAEIFRAGYWNDPPAEIADSFVSYSTNTNGQALMNNLPMDEPGWEAYWDQNEEQYKQIESDFPSLSRGVYARILYWRWKRLEPEEQAWYIALPQCE